MIKPATIMVAVTALALLVCDAHADVAAPVFKFVAAETALPKPPERTVKLLLEGTQLGESAAEPSEVAEAATGSVPASYAINALETSGSTRHWLVTATFAGDARLAAETRYMTFVYRGTSYALSFKLTERPYDWTVVSLVTDVSLYPGEGLPISISTREFGASGIHIAQSALVGQADGRLVEGGWVLCKDPSDNPADCADSLSVTSKLLVEPNSDHTFWLRPRIDDSLVGKYVGNVLISSVESPGGTRIPLTVYGTAIWRQVLGVVAIALSVAVAWFFGTYFHNKANRLQMLRPFAALRGRAQDLSAKFGELPSTIRDSATVFSVELGSLIRNLSEDRLTDSRVIPRSWFSAFPQPTDAAEGYKLELARLSDKWTLLEMVMEEGFQKLANMPQSSTTAQAAEELAKISGGAKVDPAATAADIKRALALASGQKRPSLEAAFLEPIREPTVREIDITLREMSVLTWIAVGLVATLVGSYILVIGNRGFGNLADYIFCILWGFGLPAGAQQLAQASLGTVTTALQVAAPKP